MKHLFIASTALIFVGHAATAQVAADPDVIQVFMQGYGLQVTQSTDDVGDPMLQSRIEGTYFEVYFYGCDDNGAACTSIQFAAGFDKDRPMKLAPINSWNQETRFGRAYLDDEGDPHLEYDINLAKDGVGGKNFDDSIDIWRTILADFRQSIDW